MKNVVEFLIIVLSVMSSVFAFLLLDVGIGLIAGMETSPNVGLTCSIVNVCEIVILGIFNCLVLYWLVKYDELPYTIT